MEKLDMARARIEDIVVHLKSEMKRALNDALRRAAPDADVNAHQVFQEFRRAVSRKCNTWEYVPDHYVEKDE